MRRAHRVLVAAATALAVIVVPAAAAASTVSPRKVGQGALQQELDAVVAAGAVGALAEVRSERGVWRGRSGVAEVGTRKKVPANGRFRAGSITKTFLATVVLQLADEGRLRLDDSVEEWLPGVVPDGDGITLRQLLNHTSGVYDYLRTLPFPPSPVFLENRWRTWTPDELVQRALANPPTFPPGSGYSYSNTGYALLGQVVERATGRSYDEEIERRIIRPLHLHDTELPGIDPRIRGPHPHGYVPIEQEPGSKPELVDLTEMNPSVMGATGELISSARDLNRFFTALLGGRLLPPDLLREMKTQGLEGGKTYGLGLAWHDTICGVTVYGNDGDALAYQAYSFSTEDRRRQVTLALTPNFEGDPDEAIDAFLDKAICG